MLTQVSERTKDPFSVNLKRIFEVLDDALNSYEQLNEMVIDAEAINLISKVIKKQEEWVKDKAKSTYVDPLLIELKVRLLSLEQIAGCFAKSWHPIVEIDQVFSNALTESMDYYNLLLPYSERMMEFGEPTQPIKVNEKDLVKLRVFTQEEFNEELRGLAKEIKEKILKEGEEIKGRRGLEYWEAVKKDNYEKTALTAFLLSFLISSGEFYLYEDPIEGTKYITLPEKMGKKAKSIAIKISYDEFKVVKGE
jgi:effector-binding domain-containing protein